MHVSWYLFGCARYRSPKSVSDKGPPFDTPMRDVTPQDMQAARQCPNSIANRVFCVSGTHSLFLLCIPNRDTRALHDKSN